MSLVKSVFGIKKTLNILLTLLLVFILSSCFTSKEDVNNAKRDLGIIELDKSNDTAKIDLEVEGNEVGFGSGKKEEIKEVDLEVKEEPKIKINLLTKEQFLELDDLSNENLLDGEVEITGKTTATVDKIIVTFKNISSEYPEDVYKLKQFKSGDSTFLYRAFSRYETLDFGTNTYLFEAYSGDKVSKMELVLLVKKEEEKKVEEKIEEVFEDLSLDVLPTKSTFGTPVDLGNGKISYTDLNGLEIKRDVTPKLTCETITSELAEKVDSWFFWNTCRPISEDEGISFYVVRLDGDNYVYEKHYYLSYEGIYGIQELEVGTGVTSKNIGEKNSKLKEKNEDFVITEITDDLFLEILK